MAIALTVVLSGCSPEHVASFELVNAERTSRGLRPVAPNIELGYKAQLWSEKMAAEQKLYHSDLRAGIRYAYKALGENVGYGPSIEVIHDAFMASPSHRSNILHPAYNYFGVGVAHDASGRVWTSQVFMEL